MEGVIAERFRSDSPGRKARFTDSPGSLDWQIQVQRTFRFCAISQSGESGESGETSVTRNKERKYGYQGNQGAGRRAFGISPAEGAAKRSATRGGEIADKAVKAWHATNYSNGKRRVYVTFEEVKTVAA